MAAHVFQQPRELRGNPVGRLEDRAQRGTQEQLGDGTGLTTVHVNRTLQDIRQQGLLTFRNGRVEIRDWDALADLAEFDAGYLMLEGSPHRVVPPGAVRAPVTAE